MVQGNFDQPVGLRMVKRRKRRAPDGLAIKDSAKMHPWAGSFLLCSCAGRGRLPKLRAR
jgi:hypothetical protein